MIKVTSPKEMVDNEEKIQKDVEALASEIEEFLSKAEKNITEYQIVIDRKISVTIMRKIRDLYLLAGWSEVAFCDSGYHHENTLITLKM